MNDLEGFLDHIRKNHVTRADAVQLVGRENITRLIAEGIVVENPFTERLEVTRPTEDWYP